MRDEVFIAKENRAAKEKRLDYLKALAPKAFKGEVKSVIELTHFMAGKKRLASCEKCGRPVNTRFPWPPRCRTHSRRILSSHRALIGASMILALAVVGASVPPPLPPVQYKAPKMVRGMGAADLRIRPKAVVVPPLPQPYLFLWRYPASVNPSNFYWNVESSLNLKQWSVAITNASLTNTINIKRTDPNRFYRLSGRTVP